MAKKAQTKKIVIVEDEPILLKALNIELLSQGYEVSSATDGVEALKIIKKLKPDLVLLDLLLPKMNGFDVLRELREVKTTKKLPVIILSNLDEESSRKQTAELGVIDYFVKSSTDLAVISKRIQQILK